MNTEKNHDRQSLPEPGQYRWLPQVVYLLDAKDLSAERTDGQQENAAAREISHKGIENMVILMKKLSQITKQIQSHETTQK